MKLVTFKWSRPGYRSEFTAERVNTFYAMAARNITVPYEPLCITDDPTGINVPTMELWPNPAPIYGDTQRPNCFVRLKMFSSEMKNRIGRFMWMDLDSIILDNIDHIISNPVDFGIWRPDGEAMPCNGSLVLHTPGTRPRTWTDFDPSSVDKRWGMRRVTGFHGSDQAWIAFKLDKQHDYFFGKKDGVFSYRSHLLDEYGNQLPRPDGVKLVFFNGRFNPWDADTPEWLKEHYRG